MASHVSRDLLSGELQAIIDLAFWTRSMRRQNLEFWLFSTCVNADACFKPSGLHWLTGRCGLKLWRWFTFQGVLWESINYDIHFPFVFLALSWTRKIITHCVTCSIGMYCLHHCFISLIEFIATLTHIVYLSGLHKSHVPSYMFFIIWYVLPVFQ